MAGVDGALLRAAAAAAPDAVLRRMICRTSLDDQTSALDARNSASTASALRVVGFSSGSPYGVANAHEPVLAHDSVVEYEAGGAID